MKKQLVYSNEAFFSLYWLLHDLWYLYIVYIFHSLSHLHWSLFFKHDDLQSVSFSYFLSNAVYWISWACIKRICSFKLISESLWNQAVSIIIQRDPPVTEFVMRVVLDPRSQFFKILAHNVYWINSCLPLFFTPTIPFSVILSLRFSVSLCAGHR